MPAHGADALVIVTEWLPCRALDVDRLKATVTQPVVVDPPQHLSPQEMEAAGFTCESVGRKSGRSTSATLAAGSQANEAELELALCLTKSRRAIG